GNADGVTVTPEQLNGIDGVDGATTDNLDEYVEALQNGTYVDPSNPTAEEIQAVIDAVNTSETNLAAVAEDIAGNADGVTVTPEQLNEIDGVDGATADNLDEYVEALQKGTYADPSNPTAEEIQAVIDAVNTSEANLDALAEDIAGNADGVTVTPDQLNAIKGVDGVTADNLDEYIDALLDGTYADPNNPTAEEVQEVIDAVNANKDGMDAVAEDIAGNANGITVTPEQLNGIDGVDGATADNLDEYVEALQNGTYVDPSNPTAEEIQAVVDAVNTSEANLSAVAEDIAGNADGVTVTPDQLNAIDGVDGVTADNLDEYIEALKNGIYADPNNPTAEEIQAVIDAVNASENGLNALVEDIAGNADGVTVTIEQLNAIEGVDGVTADNLDEYIEALKNGTYADPNNPKADEIQSIINTVNASELSLKELIEDISGNTNGISMTADQLNSIDGVSGVDSDNIADYNLALQAGTYVDPTNPTAEEIQAIIDRVHTNQTLLSSDLDLDLDGLTEEQEALLGTLDNEADSHSEHQDGVHGDNGVIDAHEDLDGDGLNNLSELTCELDPLQNSGGDSNFVSLLGMVNNDPNGDWDYDGISNQREMELGTNPVSANERDTNGNSIPDIIEIILLHDGGNHTVTLSDDTDGDGLHDIYEVMKGFDFKDSNNPTINGSDVDINNGLTLAQETLLSAIEKDFDNDGVSNEEEILAGADPSISDNIPLWVSNKLRDKDGVVSFILHAPGVQAGERDIMWTLPDGLDLPTDTQLTGNTLFIPNKTYPAGRYTGQVELTKYIGSAIVNLVTEFEVLVKISGEIIIDVDHDGIDDAVDSIIESPCISTQILTDDSHAIIVEEGVHPKVADYAQSVDSSSAVVPMENFMNFYEVPSPDGGVHHEVYDMQLQLNGSKDSVQTVLPMSESIGNDATLFSMSTDGDWSDESYQSQSGQRQSVMSSDWLNNEEGICPSSKEKDKFTSGLNTGHHCVLLNAVDGGAFDRDGEVNGEIHLSVTVAEPLRSPLAVVEVGRSAGGSLGWMSIMGLMGLLVRRLLISMTLAPILHISLVNAQAHPYVGAALGGSYLSPYSSEQGFKVTNHSDVAYQLFIGLEEGDFTVEGYYTEMGKATVRFTSGNEAYIKYRNFGIEGQYHYPLNEEFKVYLSSGLNFVKGSSNDVDVKEKHHSSVSIGVGVRWDFMPDWFARLQLQSYSRDDQVLLLRLSKHL
ncbi:hypothetical protein C1141_11040, partial [Vibrio agarivorans]